MKEDESLDPVKIAFFSFGTIVHGPDRQSHLVEQFRWLNRWRPLNAGIGIQPAVDHGERAICRRVHSNVIHNRLRVMSLVVKRAQFAARWNR